MNPPEHSFEGRRVIVGLSGGVDSAVAAILLKEQGAEVQALHMTNWEDDDGYCTASADLQDARHICERLNIPLHHVNFTKEYRKQVFADFLNEYQKGRTPNPDVLCNREIKFGVFLKHANRLGGELVATGHYARTKVSNGQTKLLKGADKQKDQSYFLNAVNSAALKQVIFPLGELRKGEVRNIAREYGLEVHDKKDSTGICFIGERPFSDFIATYLPDNPGPIKTLDGRLLGEHRGLMHYTLGQRQGLGIGGQRGASNEPWYVAKKEISNNTLIAVQGNHPSRFSSALITITPNWINGEPEEITLGGTFQCKAKVRYRQAEQSCRASRFKDNALMINFDVQQADVTPGQYIVFYRGDICLGGAVIDEVGSGPDTLLKAG